MPNHIDSRTTSSTSFITRNVSTSQQQQTEESLIDEKPSDIYFTNNVVVDYLSIPKSSNTTDDNNKRHSSFPTSPSANASSSTTNASTTTASTNGLNLKSIRLSPTDLNANTIPKSSTIRYEKQINKNNKLHRREKLKHATNEYEERIEEYFQQLTIGCQRKDCRNKFCASGGIMSLQPQAALVMAIQLASMPGSSRLCLDKHYIKKEILTVDHHSDKIQDQSMNKHQFQEEEKDNSSNYISVQSNSKKKCTIKQDTYHWTTDFWKLFNYFSSTNNKSDENLSDSDEEEYDLYTNRELEKHQHQQQPEDEGYYQLDHDTNSCYHHEEEEALFSEGTLLALLPITINLDTAIEHLHQIVVTKSISKEESSLWCRSIFQNWEGIGNSFLHPQLLNSAWMKQPIHFINLQHLSRFYQLVIPQEESSVESDKRLRVDKQKKSLRQIDMMEAISDSFETLLDRMILNVESLTEIDHVVTEENDTTVHMMYEWCRSLMAVIEWILCCKEKIQRKEQDGLAALVANLDDVSTYQMRVVTSISSTSHTILMQKLILVLCKIAHKKDSIIRKILQSMILLDPTRMKYIVQELQQYLLDHFHTGPYKHGLEDTVIMALKCLELMYQGNMMTPSSPIVSPSIFYSDDICKRLNIKNEYRIWKRVLTYGEGQGHIQSRYRETEQQRKSRLFFITTTTTTTAATTSTSNSPYPFENEYQFSWFSYPFLLPPSIKRKIVLMDAMSQMSLEYEDACVNHTLVVHAQKLLSEAPRMLKTLETNLQSATCPYLYLEIRRDHFISDTWTEVSRKWSDLKKPLKVKFVDGGEEGVDQGGVQKEFFGVLFEKLVSDEWGLFQQDETTRLCWIRPVAEYDIRMYEMVGIMMGLSIYNGVIMNLQFPKVLWKAVVMPNEALIDIMAERGQIFTLEDLEEGWPALGHGLRQLLEFEGDVEDVFCRDYEISMDVFGQGVVTTSLMKKEGEVVSVTNKNREAYVQDYCRYFMYTAQREPILALRRGMWSVIGSRALHLCTAEELEMVACGLREGPDAIELNMAELESIAEYDDGYNVDHPTIRQFWSVVHHDLTNEQKKQLLLFVTASDRIPVGGLKELSFYIQRNGPDSDRLPTALTCFSRLLLPEYSTRQKLRDRLITAIENTKGFGLV
ncbi:uncharacterized protein BX663DRAFT_490671 [Cokeromyces recurvatus]|uniref:uncharacterized protein n=1 Tax=Cokeromyces recurvatus TaxID=90255 RepID=UPI00221EF665|nr:uncharacterized protein BX663DRAFT_490671 [Cokeromyces recurvatus]KAI7897747.1 hypothetical protein BX663DRAFT_490671 [Cokeromyces recurvatus]